MAPLQKPQLALLLHRRSPSPDSNNKEDSTKDDDAAEEVLSLLPEYYHRATRSMMKDHPCYNHHNHHSHSWKRIMCTWFGCGFLFMILLLGMLMKLQWDFPFSNSNMILFQTIDLSSPIIMLHQWSNGGSRTTDQQNCDDPTSHNKYHWNYVLLHQVPLSTTGFTTSEYSKGTGSGRYDCTFNICNPIAEGTEGRIYDGECQSSFYKSSSTSSSNHLRHSSPNDDSSSSSSEDEVAVHHQQQQQQLQQKLPVVMKSMKRKPIVIGYEVDATRHMGNFPTSKIKLHANGWNFMIMANLKNYDTLQTEFSTLPSFTQNQHLPFYHEKSHNDEKNKDDDNKNDKSILQSVLSSSSSSNDQNDNQNDNLACFLIDFLNQIQDQFIFLNQEYYHLDVRWSNFMISSSSTSSSQNEDAAKFNFDFQMIDFSHSQPIHDINNIVRQMFTKHQTQIWHSPKTMPAMVCLLSDTELLSLSVEAYEYCQTSEIQIVLETQLRTCPSIGVDFYNFAMLLLGIMYQYNYGTFDGWAPNRASFTTYLQYHERYMKELKELQNLLNDQTCSIELLHRISEWSDITQLNTTSICTNVDS